MTNTDQVSSIALKYGYEIEEIIRTPDGGSRRSYVVFLKDKEGKKFTMKMFESSDQWALERFLKEIKNIRFIRSNIPKKYKSWIPKIITYSTKEENPFYIYDQIAGNQLGSFVYDYGIVWGSFHKDNFDLFINFFNQLAKIDYSKETFPTWGSRLARKELQYYFEQVERLLPSDLYDRIQAFYERHHNYVSKSQVLSHRDLYPENILIKAPGSKQFTFIDWEYLSLVPIGYDAAFLFLSFWREEYWKSKVFSHFYNIYKNDPKLRREFLISFRFCLIILATRFLYQMHTYGETKGNAERNAHLSFIYDLEHALTGDIVKPRNIKFYVSNTDVQEVCDLYSIGTVKNHQIFYASKGNTVAKVVTDQGSFILRFYSQSRSSNLIKRELDIFEKLRDSGINTYNLFKTSEGNLYSEIEFYGKKRRIAVLSYLQGKKLSHNWADEKAITGAGQMLRKIHDNNVIHGDYSKENVLYSKNKLTGVIDFEWGRFTKSRDAKYHDLAKAIALWLVDTRCKKLTDDMFITTFLNGYFHDKRKKDIYKKILEITLQKIENERSIFMTTLDTNVSLDSGRRFNAANKTVSELLLSYKG